ncbi:DUF2332 domain-containing protein [Tessaracoccus sp. OS52]|uniref:DUF2332 domain-containing protein n=1 Tax=Tessaracoccus sp. OS52 TaxID=2886691 RepID=UPI001D11BF0A|nr:DUF2332 domain-containing protein [Tessaracoccus sp. OS52]MCC2592379.1 DUF2332 domain-containing protein [Tessaracoccus sp. OS52]
MQDSHAFATKSIAELYRWMAEETAPTSKTWEAVCLWVAESRELTGILDRLPGTKRQPNLFLGALKYLDAPLEPGPGLTEWVMDRWAEVEAVVLSHATQTNEPGRCAVLAPVLAWLPQPITLLEVGASAGLLLVPDRYRYRYDDDPAVTGSHARPGSLELECRVTGVAPGDVTGLRISDRAGLDRNPLRADDPDVVRWLRALVWPGEADREERLARALSAVAEDVPRVIAGDALADLDRLLAHAPSQGTVVVQHSATLAYLREEERNEFVGRVREAGAHWLSFEGVGVLASIRERIPDLERHRGTPNFVVALDGEPLGFASPHGRWVSWY